MRTWFSFLSRRPEDVLPAVFTPPNPSALYAACDMGRAAAAMALTPGKAPGPYDLAPAEAAAAQQVAARADSAGAVVRASLADAEARCSSLASDAEANFANAETHASIEEQRIQGDAHAGLVTAYSDLHISEFHKRLFKDNNRLTTEPREPESLRRYLFLTTGLLGLEAAANITAFAPAMEHGYAQAFLTSVVYAGVNVGGSILFAGWIREVFAIPRWRKALGSLGLGTYAVALAEWVQLLGYYRAAVATGSEQPGADAARALLMQLPTESVLSSIEAIVLMAITAAFSIIAVVATLALREKVPGYHAVAKRIRRAKAALEALKRQYRERLRAVADRMRDDVERERNRAVAVRQALRGEIGQMKVLIAQYQGFSMALPGVLASVSGRYRAQVARLGGFEVASFQGEWPLPQPVELEGVKQKIADFERQLNALTVAGALERDATDARAAILAIEKHMLDNTDSFFERSRSAALNGPGPVSPATQAGPCNLPLPFSQAIVPAPGE